MTQRMESSPSIGAKCHPSYYYPKSVNISVPVVVKNLHDPRETLPDVLWAKCYA